MKIGVIGGTGSHGGGLALRWALAGEDIVIGSRSLDKAKKTVKKYMDVVEFFGRKIQLEGRKNTDAVKDCDVIVLSVPYTSQVQILQEIQPYMNPGTILIDVSVPLEWKKNELPMPATIPEGSCAERAASVLKGSDIRVVGAFKTIGAYSLRDLLVDLQGDIFLCSEDEEAKEIVAQLVTKIKKLRPLDAGPLSNSRASEMMVPLLIALNKRYKSKSAYIKVLEI